MLGRFYYNVCQYANLVSSFPNIGFLLSHNKNDVSLRVMYDRTRFHYFEVFVGTMILLADKVLLCMVFCIFVHFTFVIRLNIQFSPSACVIFVSYFRSQSYISFHLFL